MGGELFDIKTGQKLLDSRFEAFEVAKAVLTSGGRPSGLVQPLPSPASMTGNTESFIRNTADSIIATGMLSEFMAEHGESPSKVLSKAMYENINDRLDMLNPAEEEEAWRLAAEILDQDSIV